jgi:hypothetical protein
VKETIKIRGERNHQDQWKKKNHKFAIVGVVWSLSFSTSNLIWFSTQGSSFRMTQNHPWNVYVDQHLCTTKHQNLKSERQSIQPCV